MNKEIDIDFPLPKSRTPKYVGVTVAGIAIVSTLMFAGATLHGYMNPEKLPANQQCIANTQAVKEAAKTFSDQLVAAIDGQDAPAPDMSKVKSTAKECLETKDQVTVQVAK